MAQPARDPNMRLQVLIAEDNPVNQEVTRRMMQRLGHNATVVENGRAAVEAVLAAPYDFILMDIQMPELDGVAATVEIRALGERIVQPYIVGLTASMVPGDEERMIAAGMNECLSKPASLAVLQRACNDALRRTASTPPVAEQTPESLLDLATLAGLMRSLDLTVEGAAAFAADLLAQTTPLLLDAVADAIARGNRAAWQAEGHRLSGGALQLGARALAELAEELERADDGERAEEIAAQLRVCVASTHAALKRLAGAGQ